MAFQWNKKIEPNHIKLTEKKLTDYDFIREYKTETAQGTKTLQPLSLNLKIKIYRIRQLELKYEQTI